MRFLAMVIHDVRSPLSHVVSFARLLAASQLSDDNRDLAQMMLESAEDALRISEDLMTLARMEEGVFTLKFQSLCIPELLRSIRKKFCGEASRKGIQLTFEISTDVAEVIEGDPRRLKQVLVNLVGNALKFTQRGAVAVMARSIFSESGEPCVRFTVTDTGRGIAPEYLDDLFDPFAQVHLDNLAECGNGLGLAICNQLVDLMGGRLQVASKLGEGSEFSFSLPVKAREAENF